MTLLLKLAKQLAFFASITAALAGGAGVARANPPQLGWSLLAELTVGRACERQACRAPVPLPWRHPSFALATDATNGVTLTGRLELVCASGSELSVPLPSVPAGGAVATMGNPCPSFAAKRATLVIERADTPGDDSQPARLRLYGANN